MNLTTKLIINGVLSIALLIACYFIDWWLYRVLVYSMAGASYLQMLNCFVQLLAANGWRVVE